LCEQACKPNFVSRRTGTAIIPLVPTLLSGSSDLPESHLPPRKPGAALRSGPLLLSYLVLLRVGFTVPPTSLSGRCALTAPFHPYPVPGRQQSGKDRAVYFLLHFPCRRRTSRPAGNPPPTLAVSEHIALWSSDFPLPHPCLPARNWDNGRRLGGAAIARLARANCMITGVTCALPVAYRVCQGLVRKV